MALICSNTFKYIKSELVSFEIQYNIMLYHILICIKNTFQTHCNTFKKALYTFHICYNTIIVLWHTCKYFHTRWNCLEASSFLTSLSCHLIVLQNYQGISSFYKNVFTLAMTYLLGIQQARHINPTNPIGWLII